MKPTIIWKAVKRVLTCSNWLDYAFSFTINLVFIMAIFGVMFVIMDLYDSENPIVELLQSS